MRFSNVEIRKMMVPLILERILGFTIGMVDSIMVAGAGESVLSGVSLVSTINAVSSYLFGGVTTGGAIILARIYGSGNKDKTKNVARQFLWLAFLVALSVTVLFMIFNRQILNLAFGKADSDVMHSASAYFLIMVLTYPIMALGEGITRILHIGGDTKTPMKISLFTNILNVIGNAILILGLNMGAAGAAISSLFCMLVGIGIRISMITDKKQEMYIPNLLKYKPDFAVIRQIISIGIPNAVENGVSQLARIITASMIAGFGTYQIAANSVCNSLSNYLLVPGGAVATVLAVIAGKCIGAGDYDGARIYTKKLLRLSYVLTILVTTVMCLMLGVFVKIYNLTPQTAEITKTLFWIYGLGMCTVWPLGYIFSQTFHAAGDIKYPMFISLLGMWVLRLSLCYLFGVRMNMGVIGIWYAMIADWIYKAVFYTVRYIRGTWLKKIKEY